MVEAWRRAYKMKLFRQIIPESTQHFIIRLFFKGTPSIDGINRRFLLVGQGIKNNGLTGKIEWEYERVCYNVTEPKTNNGGTLSTPAVGRKYTVLLFNDSIGVHYSERF